MKMTETSKVFTVFSIFLFYLAVQSATAQRKAWEDLAQETYKLESKISAIIGDTIELHQKMESISASRSCLEAETDSIDKQIKIISDSIDSDKLTLLDYEIDSLTKIENSLATRIQELTKSKAQQEENLETLKNDLSKMSVYSQIIKKRKYVQNKKTLQKKYSLISESELAEIESTTSDFSQMKNFEEYKSRVRKAVENKRLYEQGISALNSPFNDSIIENIRRNLWDILFGIEKDDLQKEEFKLSEEQYSEMNTLDIQLSRYENGIKALQSMVVKINEDENIIRFRENRTDRMSCLNRMKEILFAEDEETVKIRNRYFNMIPYIESLLQRYWSELQQSPFDPPTEAESEINEFIEK